MWGGAVGHTMWSFLDCLCRAYTVRLTWTSQRHQCRVSTSCKGWEAVQGCWHSYLT